jgi:hypothetical protein
MRILALATLTACLAAPAASNATTAYVSTKSIKTCSDDTSCTLIFTAVAAGATLTITHVSCGIVTSGEGGGAPLLVLRAASARAGTLGDHLVPAEYVDGSNILTTTNATTLFTIAAGDRPAIDITATAPIVSTTDGGCLVSGTTTP